MGEEAARIDPIEAKLCVMFQEGDLTESLLDADVLHAEGGGPTPNVSFRMKLYLLKFTRHPREFEAILHEGPELEEVRNFTDGDIRLPSGATLLVFPEQSQTAKRIVAPMRL